MLSNTYTVQQLIDELQKVKDKSLPVQVRAIYDSFMSAGGSDFSITLKTYRRKPLAVILEAPETQPSDYEIWKSDGILTKTSTNP